MSSQKKGDALKEEKYNSTVSAELQLGMRNHHDVFGRL